MGHAVPREIATAVVIDPGSLRQRRIMRALHREGIEVVGRSPVLERATELADAHLCDVLVLALRTEISAGTVFRVLSKAHRHRPDLLSVAVAENDNPEIVRAALAAGAFAAVSSSTRPEEVAHLAAQALAERGQPEKALGLQCFPFARLNRREIEILRLVAGGRSNREVSMYLWVTEQTVKFHLANIYRKLGVRNRFEAGEWALKNGLVPPDEERPEGDAGAGVREPRRPIRPSPGTAAVVEPPKVDEQPDDLDAPCGGEEAAA